MVPHRKITINVNLCRKGALMSCDVLLINPPHNLRINLEENLGLGYIAACLKKHGLKTEIMDYSSQHWPGQVEKQLPKLSCQLVGVTIPFQDQAKIAFSFISALKALNPHVHINIGGMYPTFAYEEILNLFSFVDSVTLGEGEETFVELADSIINGKEWRTTRGIVYRSDSGLTVNEIRPLIKDLDSIPFPERYMLNTNAKNMKYANLLTSRGCYGRCTFCSVVSFYSMFGAKYRLRSTENVMDEILFLYNKYDVRNISISDANFIGGQGRGYTRAANVAEEILKRNLDLRFVMACRPDDVEEKLFANLKRAGLAGVFLGIESGSQAMLDRFQKDITVEQNIEAMEILKKLGLYVIMGFIPFDERVSFTELYDNALFLEIIRKTMPPNMWRHPFFSRILPYAGTEIERHMKETGIYKGNSLDYSYRILDPKINFLYSTANFLSVVADKAKRIFKSSPVGYELDWTKRS